MKLQVKILSSPNALFRTAAAEFVRAANTAVRQKNYFAVSLCGGSTPKALYGLLAEPEFRIQVPWERCFFFWGDERHVPPEDAGSNFRMIREAMLLHVPVKASQVFRISGEHGDPSEAAREYEQILYAYFGLRKGELPRFDLTLLGMGADGHTASLFPGTTALYETTHTVVGNWIEKFNAHRITMTFPVFNNAARVMFLVSGDDKARTLKSVLEGPFKPKQFPVQFIRPEHGSVLWLVDQSAGKLLQTMALQELA